MNALANRPYVKMNGLGNAILLLDLRGAPVDVLTKDVRAIAQSPHGVPFDQMMVLFPPVTPATAAFVRIFNADGSEVGACGNGTRCVAWYEMERNHSNAVTLETMSGLLHCRRSVEFMNISVDMGEPKFGWKDIPLSEEFGDTRVIELQAGPIDAPVLHSPSVVNVGNPHAIFWVEDVNAIDLVKLGPLLENHPLFPEGANISLAQVTSRTAITLKVWERGAGLTLACGTAACAAAVCAARTGRTDRAVKIMLSGGPLNINWDAGSNRIFMTGPVQVEFEGVLDAMVFAGAA
jgi:diaminopimelate epimerase